MNSLSTSWLFWALILGAGVLAWAWIRLSQRRNATNSYGHLTPRMPNLVVRSDDANDSGQSAQQKAQHSHHGGC